MKNIKLILSVLLWAVCSTIFAVTLPASSYNEYESYNTTDAVSFSLSSGISILGNASTIDEARAGACVVDKQNPNAMHDCEECCKGQVLIPCIMQGGTEASCGPDYLECINTCMGASLPLGTPLLLLPFALVYALIRRKRMAME